MTGLQIKGFQTERSPHISPRPVVVLKLKMNPNRQDPYERLKLSAFALRQRFVRSRAYQKKSVVFKAVKRALTQPTALRIALRRALSRLTIQEVIGLGR